MRALWPDASLARQFVCSNTLKWAWDPPAAAGLVAALRAPCRARAARRRWTGRAHKPLPIPSGSQRRTLPHRLLVFVAAQVDRALEEDDKRRMAEATWVFDGQVTPPGQRRAWRAARVGRGARPSEARAPRGARGPARARSQQGKRAPSLTLALLCIDLRASGAALQLHRGAAQEEEGL